MSLTNVGDYVWIQYGNDQTKTEFCCHPIKTVVGIGYIWIVGNIRQVAIQDSTKHHGETNKNETTKQNNACKREEEEEEEEERRGGKQSGAHMHGDFKIKQSG